MLKLGFLLVVVLGVLVPLLTWVERKQLAWMEGRVGPVPDVLGVRAGGLLQPLAEGLRALSKEWVATAPGTRALQLVGPVVVFVSALLMWSVVPFGGVYQFGSSTLSLVVADIDWGFALLGVAASLGGLGALIARGEALAASRLASFSLVGAVSVGLALLALTLSHATLRPVEIALAQDAAFPLVRILGLFGAAPVEAAWVSWLRLPAWGIVLQPLGFLAFTFGLLMVSNAGRSDAPTAGAPAALLGVAHRIWLAGSAAWVTALYLGGWAVPFVSTESLVSFVAGGFGTGFATGFVLLVHVLTFFVKLVAVLGVMIVLFGSHPRPRTDQAMAIGTRLVLPLALANLLLTAAAVGALGGGAG